MLRHRSLYLAPAASAIHELVSNTNSTPQARTVPFWRKKRSGKDALRLEVEASSASPVSMVALPTSCACRRQTWMGSRHYFSRTLRQTLSARSR